MDQKPLRLGVLGTGMIATTRHGVMPNLRHIPGKVELVAVADTVLERAQEAQREFDVPEVYGSLEEMLERAEIDAVANLTPIPFHGATSLQILEAGKHVVSEKPIGTTMEETDALIETARSTGLTFVCSPPNAIYPYHREARRLIREGTIGRIAFARARSSHGGPAAGNWPGDPSWFYQKGSGPLFDMGVYGIHEITSLLGPAKRVVGFSGITEPTRTVRGGPFKDTKIEVTADDNTLFMLDFGDSAYAVIDGTFNVNAARGPRIEVFGREGTLNLGDRWSGPEVPPLEVYRVDAVPGMGGWVTPQSWGLSQEQERVAQLGRAIIVDHLVDCVWAGKQPELSAEHARHALEIMIKAVESAHSGRVLDLETSF
ncbi:MAG: Gfo/Idh/MocA family oxidoreductase [Chloroflexota bacterium]|nr:Gfo/Idh/MocA family oxidoreductase [Chloroflexota bacterium]